MSQCAISISAVENWFAKFLKGEFELDDQPRSGRPKETEDKKEMRTIQIVGGYHL